MAHSEKTLREACEYLKQAEPALGRAYAEIGLPVWRTSAVCYETLARAVAYQLLSTKAAETIWGRVLNWANGPVTPEIVLHAEDEDLRACGLSGPKVRHLKSIAEAVHSNTLPIDELCDCSNEEARKLLIAVKGIGPWTADLFLMNALKRLDAFPPGDVGLMESYRILCGHEERLESKAFVQQAENWRPYRAVAAYLLWDYINKLRDQNY